MNVHYHFTYNFNFNSTSKQMEKDMSKFVDDCNALIATIATGNGTDQATKDAVTALQTQLASDEAQTADLQTVVTTLLNHLAVSTPPATDTTGAATETGASA